MTHSLAIHEDNAVFSPRAIEAQLENIFLDSHFVESKILRKFLAFIVGETLQGRSNCLKEYTIGINVLEKPLNFKPQENGIVRIHAGRLRRALAQYYEGKGVGDRLIIHIPKGKYVPVFSDRLNPDLESIQGNESSEISTMAPRQENLNVAILPFLCAADDHSHSFVDGLCMQMTSMLMRINHVLVVAYRAVKHLGEMNQDYRELNESLHAHFMITGCMQHTRDKIRVTVQIIDCTSYKQAWSETYERKLTRTNIFDIQDEICRYAVATMEELKNKAYTDTSIVQLRSAI